MHHQPKLDGISICTVYIPIIKKIFCSGYNKLLPGVMERPGGLPLGGIEVELVRILGEKFGFKPVFVEVAHDFYIKHNNTFNFGGSNSQASVDL